MGYQSSGEQARAEAQQSQAIRNQAQSQAKASGTSFQGKVVESGGGQPTKTSYIANLPTGETVTAVVPNVSNQVSSTQEQVNARVEQIKQGNYVKLGLPQTEAYIALNKSRQPIQVAETSNIQAQQIAKQEAQQSELDRNYYPLPAGSVGSKVGGGYIYNTNKLAQAQEYNKKISSLYNQKLGNAENTYLTISYVPQSQNKLFNNGNIAGYSDFEKNSIILNQDFMKSSTPSRVQNLEQHEFGHFLDFQSEFKDSSGSDFSKSAGGYTESGLTQVPLKREYFAQSFANYISNPSDFKNNFPEQANIFEGLVGFNSPISSTSIKTIPATTIASTSSNRSLITGNTIAVDNKKQTGLFSGLSNYLFNPEDFYIKTIPFSQYFTKSGEPIGIKGSTAAALANLELAKTPLAGAGSFIIPETRASYALTNVLAVAPEAAALITPLAKPVALGLIEGSLFGTGVAQSITAKTPEQRSSGFMLAGLGLLPTATELSSRGASFLFKTPPERVLTTSDIVRTPVTTQNGMKFVIESPVQTKNLNVAADVLVPLNEKVTSGMFSLAQVQPARIAEQAPSRFGSLFFEPAQRVVEPSKIVSLSQTINPILINQQTGEIINNPIVKTERGQGQITFSTLEGQQINVPVSEIKNLPSEQKEAALHALEEQTGIPALNENTVSIIFKDKRIKVSSGGLKNTLFVRADIKGNDISLYPPKEGKTITRVAISSTAKPIIETNNWGLFETKMSGKDITLPTQSGKVRKETINIKGKSLVFNLPENIDNGMTGKSYIGQKLTKPSKFEKVLKTIKTAEVVSIEKISPYKNRGITIPTSTQNLETSPISEFYGKGLYERTDSITSMLQPQSKNLELSNHLNKNILIINQPVTSEIKELQLFSIPNIKQSESQSNKILQKQLILLRESPKSEIKNIQIQEKLLNVKEQLKSSQLQKEVLKQLFLVKNIEKTITKNIEKPIEKNIHKILLRKVTPISISASKKSSKSSLFGDMDTLVEAFVRRKGKDISLGKGTLTEESKALLGNLKGTLAASGFLRSVTTGKRIPLSSYVPNTPEFRAAKRDEFRVVQQRGFRLSSGSEVKEIKAARKTARKFFE